MPAEKVNGMPFFQHAVVTTPAENPLIMSPPMLINFKNMDGSPALESRIRQQVEHLNHFYDQITGCNVTIEAPHHHHHQGYRYVVRLRISVPGNVIVVSHDNERDVTHEDPYVAVRDAFKSARRQLQDYARIRRHDVKSHQPQPKRDFTSELMDENEHDAS